MTDHPNLTLLLLANLNSIALDYLLRQNIGGSNLNFFIVKQIPVFPPDAYSQKHALGTNRRNLVQVGSCLERWSSHTRVGTLGPWQMPVA